MPTVNSRLSGAGSVARRGRRPGPCAAWRGRAGVQPGGGGGSEPGGRRVVQASGTRRWTLGAACSIVWFPRAELRAAAGETASRPDSSIGTSNGPTSTSDAPSPIRRIPHLMPSMTDFLAELTWRGLVQDRSEGLEERLATRPHRGLRRLRRQRAVAPRRAPGAAHGARPSAATRRPAGRGRGRRHGHDRRPVGQERRAGAPDRRAGGRQRGGHPGSSWSASSTSTQGPRRRAWSTTASGSRRASLLDYLRDIGKHFTIASMLEKDSVQLRLAQRPVVHRVQLHDPPGGRLPAPPPGRGCRDADGRRGPVGQHHRGHLAHPARRRGRRPTASASRCCSPPTAARWARPSPGPSCSTRR